MDTRPVSTRWPRSRTQSFGATLAIVLFCSACGDRAPEREWTPADHAQPSEALPTEGADEPAAQQAGPADPDRASRALWSVTCAGCHGRDGRGHGESIPPGAQLPDFTSEAFQHARSDAQLAQVIRDGKGMMPPFGKKLSEDGMAALVRRVRAFAESPPGAAAEPPR